LIKRRSADESGQIFTGLFLPYVFHGCPRRSFFFPLDFPKANPKKSIRFFHFLRAISVWVLQSKSPEKEKCRCRLLLIWQTIASFHAEKIKFLTEMERSLTHLNDDNNIPAPFTNSECEIITNVVSL
jgi:hypothetical protein